MRTPLPLRFGAPLLLALLLAPGCAQEVTAPAGEESADDSTLVLRDPGDRELPDSLRSLYREDAARLALRLWPTREVEIPAGWETVYRALRHVYQARSLPARDSVVEIFRIHTFPEPATRSLLVALNARATWAQAWREGRTLTGEAAVDSLMTRYGLQVERVHQWSTGEYVVLNASRPLNIRALAERFARVPGVRSAEPNSMVGDGNDISASLRDGGVVLEYSVGFGDCPAGCISRHYWTFHVAPDGRVRYLGSRGDPVPPPRGGS